MAERNSAGLNPDGEFTASEGRRFSFPVGAAFLVLAAIGWWRDVDVLLLGAGVVGGGLIVGGAVLPSHLGPVYRAWMGFAALLSRITNPIVMGIIYYTVITPVGVVRRLFGHNAIAHRPSQGSYWVERPAGDRKSNLSRQF